MGRWFYSFDACYHDGSSWEIGISQKKFRLLQQKGDIVKLSRLALVESVVESPLRIVQGWGRPNTDNCFAYVGKPSADYRKPGIETPPPKNCLFVVFVLHDGMIDYWGWRPTSSDDSEMPDGIGGKVLWQ